MTVGRSPVLDGVTLKEIGTSFSCPVGSRSPSGAEAACDLSPSPPLSSTGGSLVIAFCIPVYQKECGIIQTVLGPWLVQIGRSCQRKVRQVRGRFVQLSRTAFGLTLNGTARKGFVVSLCL